MQTPPPSTVSLKKSLLGIPFPIRTSRLSPSRFSRLVIDCAHQSDSSKFSGRAAWQSSCAILASKVVSQQQNAEKSNSVNITEVNGHKTLDLVPIDNLPKPLTITDLSPAPTHGAKLRVAYQGVPGAYSEAAAGKAYPSCEAIPCDQFEVAFQAVELWIADRAVLPVENSLGGSIHRNYDLLLRHRLHIVGEVQLPVHHCLLALPGVLCLYYFLNGIISFKMISLGCAVVYAFKIIY